MHLAPAKTLHFTDAATCAVIFSAPVPCLAQIEACIRLEPQLPKVPDGAPRPEEPAIARQRRYLAQCLALLCAPVDGVLSPLAWVRAWRRRRQAARWLRSLQYPQLLDVYQKLMLTVQGIDFESIEEFERALEAQKKSTSEEPPKAEATSSPESTS